MLPISKDLFLRLVIKCLPKYIDNNVREYIACQFALESSFGASLLACIQNNFCGMRVPSIRLTTAYNCDEKGQFAKYVSFGACISDYLLYLQALRFNKFDLNSVIAFRKKLDMVGYCRDFNYLERIDALYKQYFDFNFNPK